jgi:hypothetical protein
VAEYAWKMQVRKTNKFVYFHPFLEIWDNKTCLFVFLIQNHDKGI